MTTYSKETALYSTDAIANDIDAASKTAENYIELDGDGIKVHKVVDPDNYVRINSDGLDVFNDDMNVAHFAKDGLYFASRDEQKVFSVSCDDNLVTETIRIDLGADEDTVPTGESATVVVNRLATIPVGTEITLTIQRGATTPASIIFTIGTEENNKEVGDRDVYISYDGAYTLTVDNQSEYDYEFWMTYIKTYYEVLESIQGDCLIDGDLTVSKKCFLYGSFYINGIAVSEANKYIETRKLAWTNSNPTSNFSAQTISLAKAMRNCDEVEIYYRHNTSDDRVYYVKAEIGTRTPLTVQGLEYNRTGGRIAIINTTGIEFGAASYNTNTNNSYAIPIKIITIRHA